MKTTRVLAILLGMTLVLSLTEMIMLRTDPAGSRSGQTGSENAATAADADMPADTGTVAGTGAATNDGAVAGTGPVTNDGTVADTGAATNDGAVAGTGPVTNDGTEADEDMAPADAGEEAGTGGEADAVESAQTASASSTASTAQNTPFALTNYQDTREIALVNVENAQGSYLVMHSSDGYMIRSYENELIDQQSADMLFQAAAHIHAERIITSQVTESQLASFGLLSPACSLLYMDLEKKGFSLLIGNKIPEMDACYGMIEGAEMVYAISSSLTDRLMLPVSEYLDLRVFPEFSRRDSSVASNTETSSDENDISDITALSLYASERTVFSLERYRLSEYGGTAYYVLKEPYPLYPDWEVLRKLLFDPLCTLEGDCFAALPQQLPDWTISLTLQNRSIRILFYENEDHTYFVQREDRPMVYQISADSLPFLSLTPGTLLGGTLLRESAAAIRTLQMTASGKTVIYEINGSGSDWQAARNGEAIDNQAFMDILNALNHIYLQEEIASGLIEAGQNEPSQLEEKLQDSSQTVAGQQSLAQPAAEQEGSAQAAPEQSDEQIVSAYATLMIAYQENTGKDPLHLEFHEAANRSMIVSVNGIPAFTLLKTTVDSLLEQFLS